MFSRCRGPTSVGKKGAKQPDHAEAGATGRLPLRRGAVVGAASRRDQPQKHKQHLPIVQQDRSRLTDRSPTRFRHAVEAPPAARSSIRAARQRQIAATAPLQDDHRKSAHNRVQPGSAPADPRCNSRPMTTAPDPFRVLCVIGARPNFMKIAPIMRASRRSPPSRHSPAHRPALRRRHEGRIRGAGRGSRRRFRQPCADHVEVG